jgi:hypothetical protein
MKNNGVVMKNYLGPIFIFLTLLLTSFHTVSTKGANIDEIVVAIRSGNAAQLSRYFDNRVDISLPDKTDNYSRTQAEMVMRDFFSSTGVRNFEIKYKGESNDSKYCLGTLQTKNGDFQTKLLVKQKDNKQVLQEIVFQSVE